MKKIVFITILFSAFVFPVFSQTIENQNCPKINIVGPAGVVPPNEPRDFTAVISKDAEKYNPQFFWTIIDAEKGDEIIEGQGTPKIKVLYASGKENKTIYVEVKGLPEGCTNTALETMPTICETPVSRLIDEFSLDENRIDKTRLDALIIQANNDPATQIYIIEKFPAKTSKQVIARKLKRISDYISKIRQQDISRFTIVAAENNENLMQFWIVPFGADVPKP